MSQDVGHLGRVGKDRKYTATIIYCYHSNIGRVDT